jgi:hypothetical protein
MAYSFGTTRDNIVYMVLRMLKVLELGGTPSETMEDEVQIVLNSALKSLDGVGWIQQRTEAPATLSISVGDWYKSLAADAISVQSAYFVATDDTIGHDIAIVSARQCFAQGPLYLPGLPTHACITVPAIYGTAGQIWFNRRFSHAGTVTYVYKAQSEVFASDTETFVSRGYPEEFLQVVVLMTAIDLAPSFGVSIASMQEMRMQLQQLLAMLKTGQQMIPMFSAEIGEENK